MTFQKNSGAARRFSWVMKLANGLQKLPRKLIPPPFRILEISSAFWQSRALYVAARLDVATVLADEEMSVAEISMQVSAQPDALYRLLRMLAALDVFEEISPRFFKNNKLSSPLRRDHPACIRDMVLMHNSEEMSRPWFEQLENGVRNAQVPFDLTFHEELFSYMDRHAEFDALFSRAMDSVDALTGESFATEFDWGQFDRIIDLGGAKGSKSITILKHHPHLKAVVVDREQVIADAKNHWLGRKDPSLLARVAFDVGDVLGAIPKANDEKDVYMLSAVLHAFDDDTCITILRNVGAHCAKTGARIVVFELVVATFKADVLSTTFDLQMFIGCRGRERTLKEWIGLFERSGLILEEQVHLCSFGTMLVLQSASSSQQG